MKIKVAQWVKNHWKFAVFSVLCFILLVRVGVKSKQAQTLLYSEPIQRGSIIESVYGIGTVTATRRYQVKTGVTSTIRGLFVKEGDDVKKGRLLIDLDGARFSAPFDGTITSLPFKIGESVFSQAVILQLVDLSDRYLLVSLTQQGAVRVKRGQTAQLNFEGMREKSYEGSVESIYSQDGNFLVRINAQHLPAQLLPGMTADVAIGVAEHRDVLVAPTAGVLENKAQVKRGDANLFTAQVQVGISDGDRTEIIGGEDRKSVV